jgi:hypothetical protein
VFTNVVRRLMPEVAPPNVHPMAMPPIIRPIHAAIVDNRSVIRRAVGVVAVRVITVAIRVVSRVSVDWKSDADTD